MPTMEPVTGESFPQTMGEAKRVLEHVLDKTCAVDFDQVDTDEMIRIEEALATATQAAKEVVTLRLQRRARLGRQGREAPAARQTKTATQRVFEDIKGKRWHAFAVYPEHAATEPVALPEAYRQGWLTFRSENELRRVAPLPRNWIELSTDELRELCHNAPVAQPLEERAKPPRSSGPKLQS
jgi:hypothetical protein